MLARRLLAFAAVLLLAGAVAAALTPPDLKQRNSRARDTATTATTATQTQPAAEAGPGTGMVAPAVDSGPSGSTTNLTLTASTTEPQQVRAKLGDLVNLSVRVAGPETISIDGYGRYESGDATTPARFEFFASSAGTFPIRNVEGAKVGELVVRPR